MARGSSTRKRRGDLRPANGAGIFDPQTARGSSTRKRRGDLRPANGAGIFDPQTARGCSTLREGGRKTEKTDGPGPCEHGPGPSVFSVIGPSQSDGPSK